VAKTSSFAHFAVSLRSLRYKKVTQREKRIRKERKGLCVSFCLCLFVANKFFFFAYFASSLRSLRYKKFSLISGKIYVMTLIGFLILLLIAAVCGGIGQAIAGYDLGGCFVSIVVGFVGAYIGMWVAREMKLPTFYEISIDGKPFPVIWAIIGSAIFTLIVGLLRRIFIGRN
jgi:uncharacterized membrane protein YeaQ/YmgE (transglycosylase-associated protein family)